MTCSAFGFGIGEATLLAARWRNVVRLARALGVEVPKRCGRRRRRAVVRRVVAALYPPIDWAAEVERSAAGGARRLHAGDGLDGT